MSSARITLIALTTPFALATAQVPATEKLGSVHFTTSCRATVAPQFDRAVALLHSFEFGESIRAFNAVFAADSNCAMAQWGIALSRWGNPMAAGLRSAEQLKPGRQAVDVAMRVAPRATDRERDYVRAVSQLYDDVEHKNQAERVTAYEHAMRDLVARQPADTEAKIFYAIALVAAASPTDKTYASQLKAGEILEPLWAKQPNHPGLAHYIIHTYDYPPLAGRARAAAERYASIAPSAAHALHMPSHTFTRVGMWEESIRANERSKASALETGAIAEALHASDYAMYANLQLGREAEAKTILDGLSSLAARFDPKAVTGAAPGSAGVFALAAIPARWTLERSAWKEAAALTPTPSDYPYCEAMTYFARALGAAHTNDLSRARSAVDSLGAIGKRLAESGDTYWAEQVAIQRLGAQAWLDFAEHREADAIAHMREAATREDATEKSAVTPGPLAPARELLGDLLMAAGRRDDARAEYRAVLQKEPNRRRSTVLAK
jgi:hypothetical protein